MRVLRANRTVFFELRRADRRPMTRRMSQAKAAASDLGRQVGIE